MTHPRPHLSHTRALTRSLAATGMLVVALAAPGAAHALSQTTTGHTVTTPTFPVPASARVQPTTGGTAVAPNGTAVAPTTTATVPQTTTTTATTTSATPIITATTPPPTVTSTSAAGAHPIAPAQSTGSSKLSAPAILAAVLAALLALGCAIWGIARLQAFEPHWTLSLRHTFAEAGFRASATWAEFSDWARLGR
jgi:hypothetical protein